MKKSIFVAGTLFVMLGGACLIPIDSAQATKYQPNTDTLESTFVIRSVQPSTSKITVSYNGEKQGYEKLSLINIQAINFDVGATEDQIDENLPYLTKATPYWNKTIFYGQTIGYPKMPDYGPDEKELVNTRVPRAIDLDVEPAHILYYSVRPGNDGMKAQYVYGKIDYSLCVKSAVYKSGVECRAENKDSGGVWYWPYYNGERLQVPESEWEAWGIKPKPKPAPEPTPDPKPDQKIQPQAHPEFSSVSQTDAASSATTELAMTDTVSTNGYIKQASTQKDTVKDQGNASILASTQPQAETLIGDGNRSLISSILWWIFVIIAGLGLGSLAVYFYRRNKRH